jgi:hypothetical protein
MLYSGVQKRVKNIIICFPEYRNINGPHLTILPCFSKVNDDLAWHSYDHIPLICLLKVNDDLALHSFKISFFSFAYLKSIRPHIFSFAYLMSKMILLGILDIILLTCLSKINDDLAWHSETSVFSFTYPKIRIILPGILTRPHSSFYLLS